MDGRPSWLAAAIPSHEHAELVAVFDHPLEVSRVRLWATDTDTDTDTDTGVRWMEYDNTNAGPALPIGVALKGFIAALSGPAAGARVSWGTR